MGFYGTSNESVIKIGRKPRKKTSLSYFVPKRFPESRYPLTKTIVLVMFFCAFLIAILKIGAPGRIGCCLFHPENTIRFFCGFQEIRGARRSVSRVLSVLRRDRDDHSSGTCLATRLTRPTRTEGGRTFGSQAAYRPYSVLLPMGFALPPPLPEARCALTAPFHPYLQPANRPGRRSVFCGTFPEVTLAGR
ncbi:hypothetical protein EDC15_104212 [Acetobacter aceti NBRC 14818]|nr:hypothetical protein EDC15_104212 [Acetobacter aceti NBRC 14818]